MNGIEPEQTVACTAANTFEPPAFDQHQLKLELDMIRVEVDALLRAVLLKQAAANAQRESQQLTQESTGKPANRNPYAPY